MKLSDILSIPDSPEALKKLVRLPLIDGRLNLSSIQRIDVVSGLVSATLIFALCASFSSTLFSREMGLEQYAALGMQSHLLTATIAGFSQSLFSDLELSLAAPDIVPTLVMSNLLSRAYVTSGVEPSVSNSLALIALCTVLTGVTSFLIGRSGLSSAANSKMPEAVFNGFVVVAGLLIFAKGVKMSMPSTVYHNGIRHAETGWACLAMALAGVPHGLGMFLQKRFSWSPADVIIPLIIFSPLAVFVLGAMLVWGPTEWVEGARRNGWMLESGPSSAFYEPTLAVYFGPVDWMFVFTAAPLWTIASALFLTGDMFFKTFGTVKMLSPQKAIDREMILQGSINIISGLLCGVPGYSQMKLAAINASIVGKHSTSRIPGLICSSILCILFILGLPLIKYVPRFWLAGILYNVAMAFLVEGFYDPPLSTRQRMIIGVMVLLYFFQGSIINLASSGPNLRSVLLVQSSAA